jgi:putative restriction endonuclease
MVMVRLNDLLERLSNQHRTALEWFIRHAGTEQPWPKPLPDGTFLASQAKGIYKPQWTEYALSIRQTLGGPYPDRDPITRSDGTWVYSYYQESEDPEARDLAFTNRGLIACLRDQVPVGVMRQVSRKPNVRYHILGLALIAGWDGGYFFLEGFTPDGYSAGPGTAAEIETLALAQQIGDAEVEDFNPESIIDGRERIIASIVRRSGQSKFRDKLIELYERRCAISDCDAIEALEAAHIVPYYGPITNHPSNGLLLRADLHTLFDLGLLAINPETMTVLISPKRLNTCYVSLIGKPLRLPGDTNFHPSVEALAKHRRWAGF